MRRAGWLLLLAGMIGVLAPASQARAAACCVSATSQGVGRLLIWEDYAAGLITSMGLGLGYWDSTAEWHPYGDSYSDYEWRSEAWCLVRLGRRASIYARVPWILSYREATDTDAVGYGFSDMQLGFRYEVLSIGEILELPAVAVNASILAPTGRPIHDATEPLGADTTGRGAWVLGLGVTLEKTYLPWFVQLNLGATVPLPAERSDLGVSQRFGPGAQVGVSGGLEVVPDTLVLSLFGRFSWEAPLTTGGRVVATSARTDVGGGVAASWRFDPHWTLQAAVDTGLFVDRLGDNLPGKVTTTLGLRYGHF